MSGIEAKVQAALAKGVRCLEADIAPLRQISLVELVKCLQEPLTSMADKSSAAALHILVRCTYGALPPAHPKFSPYPPRHDVTAEHLTCLVSYFESFLENYTTADTAMEGLSLIGVTYTSLLTPELRAGLMESLFSARVDVQSLVPAARCQVFMCLEVFLKNWPTECCAGGALFLKAVVSIVDGEREPENVLRAFCINRMVTKEFPPTVLAVLLEDLFECAAGYFPVLFTPPANCSVTKAQLRDALHSALSAPVYHEFCAPLVTSKLVSPSAMTKIDCLLLLDQLIKTTPMEYFEPHIVDLLTTLRGECLKLAATGETSPDAANLLQDALGVVRSLGRMIASFVHETVDGASPTSTTSPEILQESSEVVLSLSEPIVQATMSTVETASSAGRSYATLIHALAQCHPTLCACVSMYLLPYCEQTVLDILAEEGSGTGLKEPAGASIQFKSKSTRKLDCALAVIGALLSAIENCHSTEVKNAATLESGKAAAVGASGRGLIKDNGLWNRFISPKLLGSLVATLRRVPTGFKDLTLFGHCVTYEGLATLVAIDFQAPFFESSSTAAELYNTVLLQGALGQHEDRLSPTGAPPGAAEAMATSACKALANVAFVDTQRMSIAIFTSSAGSGASVLDKVIDDTKNSSADKLLTVLRSLAKISPETQRDCLHVALKVLGVSVGPEEEDSSLVLEHRAKETAILKCYGDLLASTTSGTSKNALIDDDQISSALDTVLGSEQDKTTSSASVVAGGTKIPSNRILRFKVAALLLQQMTPEGKKKLLESKFPQAPSSSSSSDSGVCSTLDCAVVLAAASSGLLAEEGSSAINDSLFAALKGKILPGVRAAMKHQAAAADAKVPLLAAVTALTNQLPTKAFNATERDLVSQKKEEVTEADVSIAAAAARGFGGANRNQLSSLYTAYLLDLVLTAPTECNKGEELSRLAARALGSVLSGGSQSGDGDEANNAHGVLELADCPSQSIMWRQRYFATTLKPLVEAFRGGDEKKHKDPMSSELKTRSNDVGSAKATRSLAAIASLVENTPTKVLMTSSESLMKIACDLLSTAASTATKKEERASAGGDPVLLSSAVTMLSSVFDGDQEGSCLELLKSSERSAALVGLASFCGSTSNRNAGIKNATTTLATRQRGFHVLTQVARFVQDNLASDGGGPGPESQEGETALLQALSVKAAILKASKAALDDAKRHVRQNASLSRHYWSLLKDQ